uniref:Reverse transcriptase Ty1/copia-type domain-containing protein n=1 Tax=Physcomitrium patens TaxID=3218 RepID=A0A2K1K2I2_PHYPA|nr:hypothetical protein PHYPA_012459 [Physcomitrium patens]
MTLLHLLLTLTTPYNFHIHQMDVTIAFLNSIFEEEIFITQSKAFVVSSHKNKVYHLLKSLYGLKKAPYIWYDLLDDFLITNRFLKYILDINIYYKRLSTSVIYIRLYIDNLVLILNDLSYLISIKVLFSSYCFMMDNNIIEYILSIQIHHNRATSTLILSQDKYISNILNYFSMNACYVISTPFGISIYFLKKQAIVTQLNMKAEYIASTSLKKLIWLQILFKEIR